MTQNQFEHCIRLIQLGDKSGLKEIYTQYCAGVFAAVNAVVKNRHDAEDVTADFFIRLWDKAGTYRCGESHKKWLFTMAHNMAVDFLRKRRSEILVDEISQQSGAGGDGEEEEVCGRLDFEQALCHLDDKERQIVTLRAVCDLTFRQISVLLHLPLGTVTWKYRNAVAQLRRLVV